MGLKTIIEELLARGYEGGYWIISLIIRIQLRRNFMI